MRYDGYLAAWPVDVGLGSIATVSRCPRYVRFSSDSDQIADVPTRRIKCAPAARETACEPQVHPCAEQRSRTSRTRAPVALTDPSEPWWTKPVHALQLQGLSWACDHRPWSCERVLYSSLSPSWSRRGGPQRLFQAVAIRRSISASVRCSLDLNSAFGRRRGIFTVRFTMAGGGGLVRTRRTAWLKSTCSQRRSTSSLT